MSRLTTHILDTSIGKPAEGVAVLLERQNNGEWKKIADGVTNSDGRITDFHTSADQGEGIFRLVFSIADYFNRQNIKSFYPKITIEFEIAGEPNYHVPLLLNPYGFSTYRGS